MDNAAFCKKKMKPFRKKKESEGTFALSTLGGHPTEGATAPRSLMETYRHDYSKPFIVYEKLPASA